MSDAENGLRRAVKALAERWEAERYPGTGDAGWNQGYDLRREGDAQELRDLLASIPPADRGAPPDGGCPCCGNWPDECAGPPYRVIPPAEKEES